jgi:hypothetical protein
LVISYLFFRLKAASSWLLAFLARLFIMFIDYPYRFSWLKPKANCQKPAARNIWN